MGSGGADVGERRDLRKGDKARVADLRSVLASYSRCALETRQSESAALEDVGWPGRRTGSATPFGGAACACWGVSCMAVVRKSPLPGPPGPAGARCACLSCVSRPARPVVAGTQTSARFHPPRRPRSIRPTSSLKPFGPAEAVRPGGSRSARRKPFRPSEADQATRKPRPGLRLSQTHVSPGPRRSRSPAHKPSVHPHPVASEDFADVAFRKEPAEDRSHRPVPVCLVLPRQRLREWWAVVIRVVAELEIAVGLPDQLPGPPVRHPDDQRAHRPRSRRTTSSPTASATRKAMLSCSDGLPRSSSPMTRRLTPTTSASALWLKPRCCRRSRMRCPKASVAEGRMIPIGNLYRAIRGLATDR